MQGSGTAVDIGTTTIVISSGEKTVSLTNPQRRFGHDVLSRLRRAVSGEGAALRTALLSALEQAFTAEDLSGPVVIAANTVMQHLLFGYDCTGLSQAPFTPVTLAPPPLTERSGSLPVPVYTVPSVAAFLGGDIVSGLYALELDRSSENILFLDLGTNGELVLRTKGGFFATSVAAGPAFEAANITHGHAAVPGVISGVTITHGFPRVKIYEDDGGFPKGISGTGVIEAVYELLGDGLLDAHGTFTEDALREDGFPLYRRNLRQEIRFYQEDVRAVQTAKAAVRAGIEILLSEADLRPEALDQILLAGAFGTVLDVKKVCGIGLLPALPPKNGKERVRAVGNTALQGAKKLLDAPDFSAAWQRIKEIPQSMTVINLAEHPRFEESYIRFMDF